jgi:hypothetical protein
LFNQPIDDARCLVAVSASHRARREDFMGTMNDLVERHVRESELRLRHIDDLLARARQAPAKPGAQAEADTLLAQIERNRHRLAQELESLRREPRGDRATVSRGDEVKSTLETVGLELEKVLATLFDQRGL